MSSININSSTNNSIAEDWSLYPTTITTSGAYNPIYVNPVPVLSMQKTDEVWLGELFDANFFFSKQADTCSVCIKHEPKVFFARNVTMDKCFCFECGSRRFPQLLERLKERPLELLEQEGKEEKEKSE